LRFSHLQISLSVFRRGSVAPVPPEGPAHANCGVQTVRPIGVEVRRAQGFAVTPEPIHLMLRDAQVEMFWQLKSDSNGALKRDRQHGCRVSELRNIPSKTELGLEKKKEIPRRGAADWLKLNISAEEIACVSRAQRSRTAGAGRLRKSAAAQVRFVMRRRHLKIRVTADPIVREKCPRLFGWFCCLASLYRGGLRP